MNLHLTALMKSCALHGIIILLVIFLARSVLHNQGDILIVDFTLHDLPGSSKTAVVVTASKMEPAKPKPQQNPSPSHTTKKESHKIIAVAEKASPSPPQTQISKDMTEETVPPEAVNEVSRNVLPANDAGSISGGQILVSQVDTAHLADKVSSSEAYALQHAGASGYIKDHFSYIRDLIQKNVTYPLYARKWGWEGKVSVSFVISPDGEVSNVTISQSSGRDVLDKSALDAVQKASPFPKPLIHAMIKIPVIYRLQAP